jgi:xylulokinase
MLLMGIDLGTSSIKVSVVDASSQVCLASAHYPDSEAAILSLYPGWAEQDPDTWWNDVQQAIRRCHASKLYDPLDISAIGIAYQMHGLVMVDKQQRSLRNSIIWCDSRAVDTGNAAFQYIGEEHCLSSYLNSPGNFTAAKLGWVKANEPDIYDKTDKIMLPGDFIAMRLTGDATTSASALSEGIFWDFKEDAIAKSILDYFGFDRALFPSIKPVFGDHGRLDKKIASLLSMRAGIPIAYKAGDQPNNALSLNVLQPGEVAATAGTSGVIYGVSNGLSYDSQSRINSFAHVNHEKENRRIGILLCINGAGIFNRWIRSIAGASLGYDELNKEAASIKPGSNGLVAIPFGNGAERMLNNRIIGAHFHFVDFNLHARAHMVRAVQEGIAFSFRYGLDIMRENGIRPSVIRASRTNLFLSNVFAQAFADVNDVSVEFYDGDGSYGAALGAGIGAGIYKDAITAAANRTPAGVIHPNATKTYDALYARWKGIVKEHLDRSKDTAIC